MDKIKFNNLIKVIEAKIGEFSSDGEITPKEEKELVSVIDLDKNGLTTADLGVFNTVQFSSLAEIFQKHGIAIGRHFIPPSISVVRFQDYHPSLSGTKIHFADPLVQDYFTKTANINTLYKAVTRGTIESQPQIKNMELFTKDVLSVAQKLGYSKEDISTLSIHDLIFLCGKITADRLEYYHGMVTKEETDFSNFAEENPAAAAREWAVRSIGEEDAPIKQNEEAVRIDSLPPDVLFREGNGICRNYALANTAVYMALKPFNKSAQNTYVTLYTPEYLGHIVKLQHEWNIVSTVTENGVEITFVDPTWLDTRKNTPNAKPEEIYNAYDNKHFGTDSILAHEYLLNFYKLLGSNRRAPLMAKSYGLDEKIREGYKTAILEQHGCLINRRLKILEEGSAGGLSPAKQREHENLLIRDFLEMAQSTVDYPIELIGETSLVDLGFRKEFSKILIETYTAIESEYPYLVDTPCSINSVEGSPQITMKQLMTAIKTP